MMHATPVLQRFCEWVYTTQLSTSIRKSPYSFPALETIHTLGITAVVGTIAVLDFRLLGLLMKREPVSRIARQVLPWTWGGFAADLSSHDLSQSQHLGRLERHSVTCQACSN